MFHFYAEDEYPSAGFINCLSSRAVLCNVQEFSVYVRTPRFAGLSLQYIHLLPGIFSNSGLDIQREDYTAV